MGRLTIRGARDDEAVEGFGVPAALQVFGREPIEQFGVRGAFALHAEIFGGFDEASPEERLPRAIDGGASGERIGRRDQPTGQIEAIETGLGRERGRLGRRGRRGCGCGRPGWGRRLLNNNLADPWGQRADRQRPRTFRDHWHGHDGGGIHWPGGA